jgi:hypothetical protein
MRQLRLAEWPEIGKHLIRSLLVQDIQDESIKIRRIFRRGTLLSLAKFRSRVTTRNFPIVERHGKPPIIRITPNNNLKDQYGKGAFGSIDAWEECKCISFRDNPNKFRFQSTPRYSKWDGQVPGVSCKSNKNKYS